MFVWKLMTEALLGQNDKDYIVAGIYHDDGACDMEVYGNIFLKPGRYAVVIGGGNDHHYYNNLFVECNIAFYSDSRLLSWGAKHLEKDGDITKRLERVNIDKPPYSTRYPKLKDYWTDKPGVPKRNLVEKNIFCGYKFLFGANGKEALDWKDDNIYLSGYPYYWQKKLDDRTFIPDPREILNPEGWEALDIDDIGVTNE